MTEDMPEDVKASARLRRNNMRFRFLTRGKKPEFPEGLSGSLSTQTSRELVCRSEAAILGEDGEKQ